MIAQILIYLIVFSVGYFIGRVVSILLLEKKYKEKLEQIKSKQKKSKN